MYTNTNLRSRVLVLGGTTFDHIVYLDELPKGNPVTIHQCRFQETIGSTGTGKSWALHKLGVQVHLISAVGNDSWGQQIQTVLHEQGISHELITDVAGTERHINLMDKYGKRISIFVTTSSNSINFSTQNLQAQLDDHDVIVLNIIGYCQPWADQVKACNKPVWTDLHDFDGSSSYHQPFIDAAQYIQLSSDNLSDYRSLMENLMATGKELVVCTHAEKGVSAISNSTGWIDLPAMEVPVVDSNGAGDNFFAGLLFGWLQQLPLVQCLQLGTKAAALCVQSPQLVSASLNEALLT